MARETRHVREFDPDIYSLIMLMLQAIATTANVIAPVVKVYYERQRHREVQEERNRNILDSINRLQYDIVELKAQLAQVRYFMHTHNINNVIFAPYEILIGNKNMVQELAIIKKRVLNIIRDVDSNLTKIALRITRPEQQDFEDDRKRLQKMFLSLITVKDTHEFFEKVERFADEIMRILEEMKKRIRGIPPR